MKRFGEKIKGEKYTRRPGSYGVMIQDGQIGVVKTAKYDSYFLIGGGINQDESPVEALHREAKEETGSEIKIGEKIGEAVEYFYSKSEGKYIAKECHFYRVSITGKIAETGEHQLIWIDQNRLGKLYHQSHQWMIERELNRT